MPCVHYAINKAQRYKKPDSLAYRIKSAATPDGIPTARIEYLGKTEITADQMNAASGDGGERDRLSEAKDFLRDVLRARPVWGKQIKQEASEADIAWRTVERAKSDLKVQTCKDGDSGRWMWMLPGPPEDGNRTRQSSPRQLQDGGHGEDGGHAVSSPTPSPLADMADNYNSANNNNENEAYLS